MCIRDRSDTVLLNRVSLPQLYFIYLGRRLLSVVNAVRGVGAFGLIVLGLMFTKLGVAPRVIRPLIVRQIARSGLLLMPMASFFSLALGLVVIGQSVSLLSRVGATRFLGVIM